MKYKEYPCAFAKGHWYPKLKSNTLKPYASYPNLVLPRGQKPWVGVWSQVTLLPLWASTQVTSRKRYQCLSFSCFQQHPALCDAYFSVFMLILSFLNIFYSYLSIEKKNLTKTQTHWQATINREKEKGKFWNSFSLHAINKRTYIHKVPSSTYSNLNLNIQYNTAHI